MDALILSLSDKVMTEAGLVACLLFVACILLWRRLIAVQDRTIQSINDITIALTRLAERIKGGG